MSTEERQIGVPAIIDLPEQRIVYISMTGPYEQFPKAMEQLLAWIESANATIVGPPGGTYLSDPTVTPPEELSWNAWVPVTTATAEMHESDDGIGVLNVPEGRFASVLHKGPYDGIPASYGLLFTWLAQQGIEPSGPPMEVYLSDPAETPEEDLITEVRAPIR